MRECAAPRIRAQPQQRDRRQKRAQGLSRTPILLRPTNPAFDALFSGSQDGCRWLPSPDLAMFDKPINGMPQCGVLDRCRSAHHRGPCASQPAQPHTRPLPTAFSQCTICSQLQVAGGPVFD